MTKYQKAFLRIISAIFLILFCITVPVCAKEQERFTLRVGYWVNYGIQENTNGKLSGYTYDYMMKIASRNNWNIKFIPCDWNQGRELLATGELDVFGPLEKTSEREQIYDYPERSMGEESGIIYVREDNNTIFYEDPKSMDGKTIGTMEDNYFLQNLETYCNDNQINIHVRESNDAKKLQEGLKNGTIDLLASGSMQLQKHAKIVKSFVAQPFYYPTTKGNQYVLDGINHANREIQEENIYYNQELYHKYYKATAAEKVAFTREEASYLETAPILKVGYQKDSPPFIYYDSKSLAPKGMVVDLLQSVTKFSGLKFEYVPIEKENDYKKKIKDGELDFVSTVVKNENTEKVYGLRPTDTIIESTLVFIVRQGEHLAQETCTIAIPAEWIGIKNQIMDNYPDIKVKTYRTIQECLEVVQTRQADATVHNILSADRVLKPLKYQDLSIHNMHKGSLSMGLGMSPEQSPILLSVINKSIRTIDEPAINQAVYEHVVGMPYHPSMSERITYNAPVLILSILFFCFIILLLSLMSRRKLNQLAYYDPLTGEMNMNKFKEEMKKILNKSDKKKAVMVLDIDKFKSINNFYGYKCGDEMLKLMAKALRTVCASDTIICRGTADKFYLFFTYFNENRLNEQFHICTKAVEDSIREYKPSCKVILSAGICVIQPEDQNISAIIDRANIASKQVKNYHISSYELYDSTMYDQINNARTIENNMSLALEREEFIVYLQPKIELATNKIVGAEALVRWNNPEKGLIFPNEFIPLFEQNGFIVNLDFYVLEQVCKLLAKWEVENRALFTISINLSRRHLLHANTVDRIREIVFKYGVEPRFIEVELTERAFDNCDIPSILNLFKELHMCGFTVSVDDFGAGYSSLSLLKDLPIDVLKIDKSFFGYEQNCTSEKMGILLESVISLSRRLHIKTVSEGVETKQQVAMLLNLGCDIVQGYYFAKPMPMEQLEKRLEAGMIFEG
ncbi:MAG: EAL domain-containing protein [Lachnospiraceae bacterium]